MKKIVRKWKSVKSDEMQPEYDFTKAKRIGSKYSKGLKKRGNLVLIDPELRKSFPNSEAVNLALRKFLQIKQTAA